MLFAEGVIQFSILLASSISQDGHGSLHLLAEREREKIQFNNIDAVVVSTGMKSYNPIGNTGTIPVYLVGDANKVGNAQDAIHEAYELARNL